MPRLVIVTDSSADLPPEVSGGERVVVVPATFGFEAHAMPDGELSSAAFYERMQKEAKPPRPFGVPEASFRRAFQEILGRGDEPMCIVMPFDVNPSFTTASAAMLSLDDADIKVVNPGVASAGLCALLITLIDGLERGWGRKEVLDAIDGLAPQCDSLFAPADVAWLERAGRLKLVEEKLGEVEDGSPVVRVGTRIT
ncbi:MAG: DegV family protein, partial [Hyphomicrobiales bacterium]